MKVLTNSPVAITDGSDGRSPRRRGLCRRFKSASGTVSLPPVHKLWQCFGATFGDSHHAHDDHDDDRDASGSGSGGSTEAELTSSFFYGDQKEIPNHKQQAVRHSRSWHARSPNSGEGRRAVSFSYPDAGVCVDDFVGAAREQHYMDESNSSLSTLSCLSRVKSSQREQSRRCKTTPNKHDYGPSAAAAAEHGVSTDIYTMIDSMRLEKQTGRTQPIYAPPGQLVSSSFDKFMPNGSRRTRSSLDATKFENHHDDDDDDDNEHDASSIASDSLFTTYTTATAATPFLVFEQEDDDASTVYGNGMPSPTTVRATFATSTTTTTTTTTKPSTSRHLKLRSAARAMTNRQSAACYSGRHKAGQQGHHHPHFYGDDDDSVFMGVVRQHWDTNWAELGSDSTDSTGSGSGSAEADEDLGASHGSNNSFYVPNLHGQTDALEDRFPTTHNVKSAKARPLKQKLQQKQQLLSSLPPLDVLGPLPPPHSPTNQNRRTGNSNNSSSSQLSRYYYDHLLSSLMLYEKVEV